MRLLWRDGCGGLQHAGTYALEGEKGAWRVLQLHFRPKLGRAKHLGHDQPESGVEKWQAFAVH